ncbi:hypothetical protein ACIPMZ_03675 [Scandinavium goeteborgense]|uniref:RHS repeat domain-containing protein n=1 Tax=Scandinavium goeteborgense TaxID=1851514 RepID=UPI00382AE123
MQVSSAGGEIYCFKRDAASQVISETDFTGRTVQYMYDAAGRRVSAQHPDDRQMRWHYSCVIGVLIQLPFIENPLFHGSLTWMFAGNDVSWIIGWFGTALLYLALHKLDRRALPAQTVYPS